MICRHDIKAQQCRKLSELDDSAYLDPCEWLSLGLPEIGSHVSLHIAAHLPFDFSVAHHLKSQPPLWTGKRCAKEEMECCRVRHCWGLQTVLSVAVLAVATYLACSVTPDLWSCGLAMNGSIGLVLKLLQNIGVVCLRGNLLCFVDCSSHGLRVPQCHGQKGVMTHPGNGIRTHFLAGSQSQLNGKLRPQGKLSRGEKLWPLRSACYHQHNPAPVHER